MPIYTVAPGPAWNAFLGSENKWICEMCHPEMVEIGEIAPTIYLGKEGEGESVRYHLVGGQGHRDDIFWSNTPGVAPYVDPFEKLSEELSEEELNANNEWVPLSDAWLNQTEDEMFLKEIDVATNTERIKTTKLDIADLRGAYFLVEELKQAGYDPIEGSAEYWLYNKMGKLVEEYNAKV
jgi:hypothetical protein